MLRILIIAGTVLALAAPALAGSFTTVGATGQTAAKPTSNTSSGGGRTLSDYNIQKE